jgi:hypothetical protein
MSILSLDDKMSANTHDIAEIEENHAVILALLVQIFENISILSTDLSSDSVFVVNSSPFHQENVLFSVDLSVLSVFSVDLFVLSVSLCLFNALSCSSDFAAKLSLSSDLSKARSIAVSDVSVPREMCLRCLKRLKTNSMLRCTRQHDSVKCRYCIKNDKTCLEILFLFQICLGELQSLDLATHRKNNITAAFEQCVKVYVLKIKTYVRNKKRLIDSSEIIVTLTNRVACLKCLIQQLLKLQHRQLKLNLSLLQKRDEEKQHAKEIMINEL